MEQPQLSYITDGNVKSYNHFFSNVWQFLIKWNINTLWLPVLLCSIYSREKKTYPHRDLHMNIHSNFVASNWKQPKTSINRKRGKQIVIYSYDRIDSTMNCYSETNCYCYMQPHKLISHTLCQTKGAKSIWVHAIWCHWYEDLEPTKLTFGERNPSNGCLWWEARVAGLTVMGHEGKYSVAW